MKLHGNKFGVLSWYFERYLIHVWLNMNWSICTNTHTHIYIYIYIYVSILATIKKVWGQNLISRWVFFFLFPSHSFHLPFPFLYGARQAIRGQQKTIEIQFPFNTIKTFAFVTRCRRATEHLLRLNRAHNGKNWREWNTRTAANFVGVFLVLLYQKLPWIAGNS